MACPAFPDPPESILRAVLRDVPAIIWTTDTEPRCTWIEGAALRVLSMVPERIVGKTPYELLFPPNLEAPLVVAHRRALQGETAIYEQAWRTFTLHGTVGPFYDATGQIVGCVGICQDITAKKLAENALRQSEQHYREIIEEATEPISRFTPDTILKYVNDAYCRLLGVSREELVGTSLLRFVAEDHQKLTRARLAQLSLETPICHNEERMVMANGEVRWLHWVNQAIFDKNGKIVEIQSVGRDITERVEAERRIRREQENLKQALDLYDRNRQLISYEIHDGLAQYLAGAIMQLDTYRQLSGTTTESAEKAFSLAQSLLSKSLREARRLISDLRPPILDESGVVAAIEHLVHDQMRQSPLQIVFTHRVAFDRLPAPLENALFRIVQESVTNAARHSHSDKCWIHLQQKGESLWLEIKDRGVGFDPKCVSRESFGLKGIRERVRLLRGKAVVKSSLGKGTRVLVLVPLVPPEDA